jgi:dTDP-4-dehydrorhamnose reductase
MDLQDRHQIAEVVEEIEPDVIIHTAALANADLCERRKSIAYDVNVAATKHLAQCAEDIECRFLYISTDLVFDGQRGQYTELDTPRPVNYYGETKLRGEEAVQTNSRNYLILRTALMYGPGNGIHGSFLSWMQRDFQLQQPISLYTDQYRTPLCVYDGIRALLQIMETSIRNDIFHLGGGERINRYEFGKLFAQVFGYDSTLLLPVTMQEGASNVPRGADCSLNSEKIQHALPFTLSDVTLGLQQVFRNWEEQPSTPQ